VIDQIGAFLSKIGPSGVITLVVGFLLLLLVLRVGKSVLDVIARLAKLWSSLPLWGKQIVAAVALFGIVKVFWPVLPKTTALFALAAGGLMTWWVGAMQLARRYGIEMDWSGWNVWVHHANTVKMQRGLTEAVGEATTKKNGRSRAPSPTATGFDAVLEPPDGLSASDFADQINDGSLAPSVARKLGWGQVKGMTATAQEDHTVSVHVDRTNAEAGEVLVGEEWFT